ncbi:NlpC/P60 family protein [Halioxenophilus sp. WMMB6]|uniref:NlpC/P60 family protein n=1 Tax=Halioxenophilus sp. WMMB6 TaxID=3073815 RepID=UPI00295EE863|nr:NlpC/P60 family protein [Halioxenophilus sp. WMMB6]
MNPCHGYSLFPPLLGLLLALAGCASSPPPQVGTSPAAAPSATTDSSATTASSPVVAEPQQAQRLEEIQRQQLLDHFQQWRGTPYRYGGLSQQGVDCSGFVFITFQKVFAQTLPRTTQALTTTGQAVPLAQAKVGDLLIFHTGNKQRHVGIYIGNNQFIHASTSQGVITSSLTTHYWRSAYRGTRRVHY